jgi:flagellar assembly protein FliH
MEPNAGTTIESFQYPEFPAPQELSLEALGVAPLQRGPAHPAQAPEQRLHGDCEQRLAEEKQRSYDAGWMRGLEEGARAERSTLETARQEEDQDRCKKLAAALAQFDREREGTLHALEGEVVELALAVAARILRREAQMDPLLLTGAVRVALGQLSASTRVRLKVPGAEAGLWSETMAHLPNLAVKPEVVPVAEMCAGECELETSLGTVDLGLRAQLAEIERGFFDRAGKPRGASSSNPSSPELVLVEPSS